MIKGLVSMSNSNFKRLRQIVAQLFDEQKEHSWVQNQTWRSIANYSQEEVYELIDAIESGDLEQIKDELADWCFHLLIYAEMADRDGAFSLDDIANAAIKKLESRHSDKKVSSDESHRYWQKEKYKKKFASTGSLVSDIPKTLPVLLSANKMLDAVKQIDYDVLTLEKAREKLSEGLKFCTVVESNKHLPCEKSKKELTECIGSMLFSCVAIANKNNINPEEALRSSVNSFNKKIRNVEKKARDQQLDLFSLDRSQLDMWFLEHDLG